MAGNLLLSFDGNNDGAWTRRGVNPDSPPPEVSPFYLINQDFTTWPLGTVSTSAWNTRMGGGANSSELGRHLIVTNPDLGGRAMQITCLAGVDGPSGGTNMQIPLAQQFDDIWYEYKYKLVGADFDLGLGAKKPGPSGVKPGINGAFPTGCKTITDEGWSVRHMWAGHSGMPDFTGNTYIYGNDKVSPSNCGEDGWWYDPPTTPPSIKASPPAVKEKVNSWQTTRGNVKLNSQTSGTWNADGIIRTWQDDVLVYDRANRRLRIRADVHASHFLWSWFYGGDATWAPATDQRIWVSYLKVWTVL